MAQMNDLVVAINDPAVCLYSDEFLVIIADEFPKSLHHYLVMPKEDIQDVNSLDVHHVPKLIYMELKGLEFVMRKTGLPAQSFQ